MGTGLLSRQLHWGTDRWFGQNHRRLHFPCGPRRCLEQRSTVAPLSHALQGHLRPPEQLCWLSDCEDAWHLKLYLATSGRNRLVSQRRDLWASCLLPEVSEAPFPRLALFMV